MVHMGYFYCSNIYQESSHNGEISKNDPYSPYPSRDLFPEYGVYASYRVILRGDQSQLHIICSLEREPTTQARRDLLRGWNLSRGEVALLPNINNNRVFVIVFKSSGCLL
jgi:hypothetical protein